MKNATLFVDFDHLLFNTEDFKKELSGLVLPSNIQRFVYEDAADFLKYADKYFTLVLFTEGDKDFQHKKVIESGILKIVTFKKVIIVPAESKPQKIPVLRKFYEEPMLIIEDKPLNVDVAIQNGFSAIRVRRGKYKEIDTKEKPTFEVKSLKEVIDEKILERWLKT